MILQVLTDDDRRGAQVFGVDLGRELQARGRRVRTVALAPGRVGGLDVGVLGPAPLAPATLRALRAEIRRAGVVVAHGSTTLPACAAAGAGTGVPLVYRSIGDPRHWGAGPARRLRVRLYYRRVAHAVALWPGSAQALAGTFGVDPRRISVIPNGVPEDRCAPVDAAGRGAARRALDLPQLARVVVYVGALAPEKEVGTAIRAVAGLPHTHLLVIGDGPERAALAGLAGGARLLGAGDPAQAFAAADVVVLPSRTEGMPGVLVEAGLRGLPAVATAVGGVAEVVLDGRTGRLVPPGDVAALRAALGEVLPHAAELGAAARAHCRERFTMAVVGEAWDAVLARFLRPRPRVLSLIKGLGPGGAERLLVSAAQVRDRAAFDHEVAYLLPHKDHLVPELAAAGVAARCLDASRSADLRWALRLRRRLADHPVDVVHVHSPLVAAVARPVVRSLPRRVRPRLVSTEHNGWWTYGAPTRLLNAWTARLDDATVAVSDEVRDSIAPGPRARVEVVVHGVPIAAVRAALAARADARRELGAGPDTVLVGTVANLRAQKAYPDLLDAARSVLLRGLPVRFVAVGHGPLEAELHARHARLGLGDGFRFLGYRADATRILAACDLFVLASTNEGLPVALMEALVLGLPVVATAVGGIPQAVTDDVEGLLVPPCRPGLLAAAIAALSADPERRTVMGKAAARRGEDFDIRRATARIEAVYREVLRP